MLYARGAISPLGVSLQLHFRSRDSKTKKEKKKRKNSKIEVMSNINLSFVFLTTVINDVKILPMKYLFQIPLQKYCPLLNECRGFELLAVAKIHYDLAEASHHNLFEERNKSEHARKRRMIVQNVTSI